VARVVYIGDEVTAAGFRLSGLEARAAEPSEAADVLQRAVDGGVELILLSGALVEHVPPRLHATLLTATTPLVAIVADVAGQCGPPDIAREVRDTLGIEA
jgi:vacuolar-type H+-ATPase subunit F/Vma7